MIDDVLDDKDILDVQREYDLNENQLKAVIHKDGPMLVLAGAGTGKTKVLTSRIAYLVKQNIAKPQDILAVTFTNKASREMQDRVLSLTEGMGNFSIGTFHSLAARILRNNAEVLNLRSDYTIINADDQIKLIKQILSELNIHIEKNNYKNISLIISKWKDSGLLPDMIKDSDLISEDYKIAFRVYEIYQKKMHSSNLVDFGDLLLLNNKIFFDFPEILKFYQNKFKYVLIDEYQDTNPAQYLWARMIAAIHKNIFCVGDDDQSIYSWRGAEVKNILRFEKDFPGAKVVKLEQNYRSNDKILLIASSIIKNNKNRHSKTLWTNSKEGEKVNIVTCFNDRQEASFVANQIKTLINLGYQANDIAILVRAGAQTRIFEDVFLNNTIHYKIVGGFKFYERQEIRDALAYIRLILNHNDDLAFERIINTPKRSIGPTTISLIREYANLNNCSLFNASKSMLYDEGIFKKKTLPIMQDFVEKITIWYEDFKNNTKHSLIVKKILEESGYLSMWKQEKTEESRSRLDNLSEMVRAIDEFEDIYEFMQYTSLLIDSDNTTDEGDKVNLMTVHSSKGLEFKIVFIPGLEEGVFPHQKSYSEGELGMEEERRLLYVAVTRAREMLFLSNAETRRIYTEFQNSRPSRFLSEIPDLVCKRIHYSGKLNSYYDNSNSKNLNNTTNFSDNYKKFNNLNFRKDTKIESDKKYRPGVRVNHKIFGNGIIIRVTNDNNLEIAFDQKGLKVIKENFVEII